MRTGYLALTLIPLTVALALSASAQPDLETSLLDDTGAGFVQLNTPQAAPRSVQRQVLHTHIPAAAARLEPLGPLEASTRLDLAVGLPLRNQAALTNLLHELYDPASPQFHHFLTPEQFATAFGPTEADYQALAAFAKANGLEVKATHPNRMLLDVSGSVADVEKALHLKMHSYRHPTESRNFYAPDAQPSVDLAVPLAGISGLENYSRPKPRLVTQTVITPSLSSPISNLQSPVFNFQSSAGLVTPSPTISNLQSPNLGSGPSATYMGNDFRAAYLPGTSFTGTGQVVGLLQFDGYAAADIAYYEAKAGLPNVPLQNVLLDGFDGQPSGWGGEVEVCLDIEMAISMAPGLSKIIVYEAGPYGNWHDILNRIATDNLAKQISCSWYTPNGGADPVADAIFQQMAAQGQSFFNASGDYDAFTGLIDFPGDTPYITQVGGTTLATAGPGGAWASEVVWNRGNGIGSGGGISTQYPIPDWQTNVNMTAAQGSTTMRDVPDVALTAENVYVRADGVDYSVGGTSCAAPLWAGLMGLVNQKAVAAGKPTLGFLNPLVYALGRNPRYSAAFHDITTGDNTSSDSPTRFYAVPGYDLCTGWGTPAGPALIDALATPDPLEILPFSGFTATGPVGGPFAAVSQNFTLTNVGAAPLAWSLANTNTWLQAAPSGGSLSPGGPAATVTVSLDPAAAAALPAGSYNASVWFTNLDDSIGQSVSFTLAVLVPPTVVTPPADQPVLQFAAASFTVAADGSPPLAYRWQHDGVPLADGGNISGAATTNLTVANVSPADLGEYRVVVSNPVGVVTSEVAHLTIVPSAPVIAVQPASQIVPVGLNATFSVGLYGSTPFSFQWRYNDHDLDGETNATLVRPNVQLTNAGNYSVFVTNSLGSVLSSNAVLTPIVVPVIVSFTPPSAPPGSTLTITGTGFDPVPANNTVYFGAVRATVTSASANTLLVTVPAGATVAPITVAVSGLVAYSQSSFQPTFAGDGSAISSATLGASFSLPASSGPIRAMLGDLDGDGKPDIVVVCGYANNVSIYQNISTNGSLSPASFAAPVVLPIGTGSSNPYWLTVADVDGDGKLDLIVPDLNANQVAIYRNVHAGGMLRTNSFAPPVRFAVGGEPMGILVRDLDGDGRPDIAVANFTGGTVSILRNTGIAGVLDTNSFAPKVDFVTGSGCQDLTIADFDGDGEPDLAASSGSAVRLFQNTSTTGTFTTNSLTFRADLPAPSGVSCIQSGDIDGDGKLDIVFGSYGVGSISVLRNLGAPGVLSSNSFAPRVDFAAGTLVHYVALGDLNGDGKPDIAVVGESPSHLSLFQNLSTPGSFTSASLGTRVDFVPGSNPPGIAIGDLDGDGRMDIVIPNAYGSTVTIFRNATPLGGPPVITSQPADQSTWAGGSASFMVAASGSLPLGYQWKHNEVAIDGATNALLTLTNVGQPDVGTYAVRVSNTLGSILSSNAALVLLAPSTNAPPVITSFSPLSAAPGSGVTISGTGFDPLPANNIVYLGAVRATVNSASPTSLSVTVPAGATYAPITVAVNGLVGFSQTLFRPTFAGNGSNLAASSFAAGVSLPTATGMYRVTLADLDGDGRPDIILACGANNVTIFQNISTNGSLGASSFAPPVVLPVGSGAGDPYWLTVADVDGDGKLDLVLPNNNSGQITIFRNVHAGGMLTSNSFAPPVKFGVGSTPMGVVVRDLDGDGRPDIAVANFDGGSISVLRNTGRAGVLDASSFAPKVDFPTAYGCQDLTAADFDGDGKPDLAASCGSAVRIFQNNSTPGAFTTASLIPRADLPAPNGVSCIQSADVDGDGKPDLVFGSYGASGLAVFRNLATPGPLSASSFAARVDFAAGTMVHFLALGDFTGSGRPDIAVVGESPSHLGLFQNLSTPGSFTASSLGPRVDFTPGSNPPGVAIGDLDGDGRPDVVVANAYTASIMIYKNLVPFGGPPVITSQPTNQTVWAGTSVAFSVGVSGTSPFTYRWNFNGTNIAWGTNSTLTLMNVQLAQAGNYAVLVSNSVGSALSSNAVLTVLTPTPPSITTQPLGRTNLAGTTATFTVAANGTAPLGYRWSKNGLFLADGGKISGSQTTNLALSNVQDADAANYTVVVTNMAGAVTSSVAALVILDAPAITTQPASQSVPVGGTASFNVVASGTPPLSYQWQKDNAALGGQTNTTLTLTNVQLSQSGNYSVVVTNAYGSARSANANLTVYPPVTNQPVIVSFTPLSAAAGASVTITGVGFDSVPTNNTVYFGAARGVVTSACPTSLTVTVPLGATYAPPTLTVNGLVAYANALFEPTFFGSGSSLTVSNFAAGFSLTTPNGMYRVTLSDLDGDGKPDIALACGANNVTIYQNISTNGSLGPTSFAAPVVLSVGTGAGAPYWLTVADVDGDGKLDLVVPDNGAGQVVIFRNIHAGGRLSASSFAAPVKFAVGSSPMGIVVRDLDGDGRPDIAVANFSSGSISILRNTGRSGMLDTNSFAPKVDFATGSSCQDLTVADFDGDGKPDLAASCGAAVRVFQNVSTPGSLTTNSFTVRADLPAPNGVSCIQSADVDGDGKPDVVFGSYGGGTLSVFRNIAGEPGPLSSSSFAGRVDFAAGTLVHELTLGDLNGDGRPDIAVVGESSSHLSLFPNLSTPASFTNSSLGIRVDLPTGSNPPGVFFADIDGDGRPDMVVANAYTAALTIYRNITPFGGGPTITSQPTNQTVIAGATAQFGVTAAGLQVCYQWTCWGTNLPCATNALLSLTNVQPEQAGNYVVRVSNPAGFVLSSNAWLTVLVPPAVVTQPASQLLMPGCDALLTVETAGTAPFSYQWWKDNTPLFTRTNATIILTNLQPADFGRYCVVVQSSVGWTVSSNALLAVDNLPVTVPSAVARYGWGGIRIWAPDLLANDTDADGDALSVIAVSPYSLGGGIVSLRGNWVFYAPAPGTTNADSFTYTVSDGHCGGTVVGSVSVQIKTDQVPTGKLYVEPAGDGSLHVTFVGLPGWTYRLQSADDLASPTWHDVETFTTDVYGSYERVEPLSAQTRFFRSTWP